LNMIEEIRFAERESERKSQNVLRLMGQATPQTGPLAAAQV
jgi:hypothetical protein